VFERIIPGAAALAAAVVVAAPAQAATEMPCSPNATLESYTDALNKTTFGGHAVGGLSALPRTSGNQAYALVDNQGATPARFFTLKLKRGSAEVTKVTTLKRADGTTFTGQNLDGEGLVVEPEGTILASSETEPVIRRFDKQGDQLAQLSTPPRFGVAPNGQAATNLTFEGLTLSNDGKTLYAGMEGPLSADGSTATGRPRLRFIQYDKPKGGDFIPGKQFAYLADPAMNVTELAWVDEDTLLVLERGFDGTRFSSKLFQVFLDKATDVSTVAALTDASPFLYKKLLLDVGKCPNGAALLDNIEGMALGDVRGDGRQQVTLISDDNFNAAEVTRIYDFSITLFKEPVLEQRATYPATQLQPGPDSGTSGVDPNNGQTPPFKGQPIPGFSGALLQGPDRYLAMPDNGFGTKGNSRDFLLRVYKIRTNNATEKITVDGFLSLRDPDKKIPFEIVNQNTSGRLLTGGDFDIEALARDRKGDLWFGDEFGPYLLHTDATGKVLDAPFALDGAKSPSSPDLEPGETPTIQGSRGWEAVASSKDGRFLYPVVEGYRTDDTNQTRRWIYEFSVDQKRYTGRRWAYRAEDPSFQIGDMQVLDGQTFLLIERDDFEGPAAKMKKVFRIDLDDVDGEGFVRKTEVVDLLRIRDPYGISLPIADGDFGLGDPFSYPIQSLESIVVLGPNRLFVVNDNNFPDSNGRHPGRPDDIEAIVVRVPGGLEG
jgi:hypothetical protein